MFRYLVAIVSALLTFSLIQLSIVPVVELGRSVVGNAPNIFHLFVAFLDWAACIACVLLGVSLAPARKLSVAVGLSLTVAIWHMVQIFVIISFAQAIGEGLVPLSLIYYGGLIVTGALCCLVYEQVSVKHHRQHRLALANLSTPSVYKQALKTAAKADAGGLTASGRLGTLAPSAVPLESGFFDFDLILLEDELLKIKPDRDSYISALRLGMAIERDCNFVNCRARSSSFAELMQDVSRRLAATFEEEAEWISLAAGFRLYPSGSRLERQGRLTSLETLLNNSRNREGHAPAVFDLQPDFAIADQHDEQTSGALAERQDSSDALVLH